MVLSCPYPAPAVSLSFHQLLARLSDVAFDSGSFPLISAFFSHRCSRGFPIHIENLNCYEYSVMHRLHFEPPPSPSSSPAQRDQFARRAAFYINALRSQELRNLSEAKYLSNQPNKHLSKRSLRRSRARGRKRD